MTEAINPLKAKLAAGECVAGFMVTMPSGGAGAGAAGSGADFLIVDMEHGPIDLATAHAMVAATRGTGAVPIVRVPWTEPWLAKPVLDTGAMGVNPDGLGRGDGAGDGAGGALPAGGARGYAPSYAPLRWGLAPPDIAGGGPRDPEHRDDRGAGAVERLDEILAVPGIDVVVIASFDLSMSMGVPGRFDDPELLRLVAVAEEKVRRAGLPLGGVAMTPEMARAEAGGGLPATAGGLRRAAGRGCRAGGAGRGEGLRGRAGAHPPPQARSATARSSARPPPPGWPRPSA